MGMDVVGRNPKNKNGEYFRANVWSWRVINHLNMVGVASYYCDTGYNDLIPVKTFEGMTMNDGKGLRSERKCNLLADRIEKFLEIEDGMFSESWSLKLPTKGSFGGVEEIGVDEEKLFYIDVGFYCDEEGKFLKEEDKNDSSIKKHSPYRTNESHLREWIDFLRNCGGFRVW